MRLAVAALLCVALAPAGSATAALVDVRHVEGVVHGFLILRTQEGKALADGDLIQVARGDRVTSRLVFHFRDGSLHDETAIFSQRGHFQLVRDHLVQRGPSFPNPMETTVDAGGLVTVRYREKDGAERVIEERMQLPEDVANGLILTLLKNLPAEARETTVSMVAATPKPRVVRLVVSPAGEDRFSIGGSPRAATHYVVRIEIGGLTGVLASLLGKKPPDTSVWILHGEAPAFIRSEGPLYFGGPIWTIELMSPVWPKTAAPAGPDRRGSPARGSTPSHP